MSKIEGHVSVFRKRMKLVAMFTATPSADMPWRCVETYMQGTVDYIRCDSAFQIKWVPGTGYISDSELDYLENNRRVSIDETRERLTLSTRADLAAVFRGTLPVVVLDLLPEIDKYLLACYPPVIPEPMNFVLNYINEYFPGWDFSNITEPFTISRLEKENHLDLDCDHECLGFVAHSHTGITRYSLERCNQLLHPHVLSSIKIQAVRVYVARLVYGL